MTALLIIFHILICVALVMIVLLQTGKGADMGATFGGGSSQTLFGSTGAASFLTKSTTFVAVAFMVTSLGLAYISSSRQEYKSVVTNNAPIEEKANASSETPSATETGSSQAPMAE
jgi:preprotein translocase subunit SecG